MDCVRLYPSLDHALGHVTVQDSDSGPSCMTSLGQWDAHKYDLPRGLESAYTVGLVCFSLLPLPSEGARASLLGKEKCVD